MLAKRYGTFIPTRFDYDSANLAVRNRSAQAELGQKPSSSITAKSLTERLLAAAPGIAKEIFQKVKKVF
jgi:hypothetical protein